jgi:hypothetical protein
MNTNDYLLSQMSRQIHEDRMRAAQADHLARLAAAVRRLRPNK